MLVRCWIHAVFIDVTAHLIVPDYIDLIGLQVEVAGGGTQMNFGIFDDAEPVMVASAVQTQ